MALEGDILTVEEIWGEVDEESPEGDIAVDEGFEGVLEEAGIYGEIVAGTLPPINLSVETVTPAGSDFSYGAPVPCTAHVHNAGDWGNQTIEWQVIKYSDSSVISSGSQSSGIIAEFGSANVGLTGITAPSGSDMMFVIRARIDGASAWINSFVLINYILTAPANPIPRG